MSDTEQATDRELWRRAVGGEPEAFGVLFDRHAEPVRGYCARRTGSLEVADDLVSVVFLEAWRRRADVELLGDSALPWLYGIAHHTLMRRWRTTTRHRRALERLAATEASAPDHADDVAGRLDDQRELARLREALRGLRRTDQEVLTLCLWQGLDYESAALALGIPVGTVRSRLSRARARLRDAVDLSLPAPGDRPGSLIRMETP
ncbi:RNA polymerase sigma factor [Blastococcus sp. SYSU DS0619]